MDIIISYQLLCCIISVLYRVLKIFKQRVFGLPTIIFFARMIVVQSNIILIILLCHLCYKE